MRKLFMYSIMFLSIVGIVGCQNDSKYELIFDPNSCLNCYIEVYKFEDGTTVYHSCANIKYKNKTSEFSLTEAIDKKLINTSDLVEHGFKIVAEDVDPNMPVCSE